MKTSSKNILASVASLFLISTHVAWNQELEVLLTTGAEFSVIKPHVSINNAGTVAFSGTAGGIQGAFVITEPAAPISITPAFADYDNAAAINNSHPAYVSVLEHLPNSDGTTIAAWPADGSKANRKVIGSSVATFEHFTRGLPFTDINDVGVAVFSAFKETQFDLFTSLMIGDGNYPTELASWNSTVAIKPQLSDENEVVLRDNNERILAYSLLGTGPRHIASEANGFSTVGVAPGISPHHGVVAFVGDRGDGDGIFVSIPNNGTSHIFHVAGEGEDAFGIIEDSQRVGVVAQGNSLSEGLAITVVFVAWKEGLPGVQAIKLTTGLSSGGAVEISSETSETIMKWGDTVDDEGTERQARGFSLYDPLSESLQLAFHVQFSGGISGIMRTQLAKPAITTLSLHRVSPFLNDSKQEDEKYDPISITPDSDGLIEWTDLEESRVSHGLIADGVTPLLVRFSMDAPRPVTVELVHDGNIATNSLMSRVKWLSGAEWLDVESVSSMLIPTGDSNSVLFQMGPLAPSEIGIADGEKQINVTMVVKSDGEEVANIAFGIHLPPVVLVHGYNADKETWTENFLEELEKNRREELVYPLNYGNEGFGPPIIQKNTHAYLTILAKLLDETLIEFEDSIRTRWAFTNYDIVAHSQGGVLTRMLCEKGGVFTDSGNPFSNADNFYRGRFRRIITIGSPHNGSLVLAYSLRLLKQMDNKFVRRYLYNLGRLTLLQEKFDPFKSQIRQINNSSFQIDEKASFHLITTAINSYQPPSFGECVLSYHLLGLCGDYADTIRSRGSFFLPLGSDGIVDYFSQRAGRNTPYTQFDFKNIVHADFAPLSEWEDFCPGLAKPFGVGPMESQTSDPAIAELVASLLISHEGEALFGEFELPPALSDYAEEEIEFLSADYAEHVDEFLGVSEVAIKVLSPVAVSIIGLAFAYDFLCLPPGYEGGQLMAASEDNNVTVVPVRLEGVTASGIENYPNWQLEIYGDLESGEPQVDILLDAQDVLTAYFIIPGNFRGAIVGFASFIDEDGNFVPLEPVEVFSNLEDETFVDIEFLDLENGMELSETRFINVGLRNEAGDLFWMQMQPENLLKVASEDESILSVTDFGMIEAIGEGITTLTASYGGLVTEIQLEVKQTDILPRLTNVVLSEDASTISITVSRGLFSSISLEQSADLINWSPVEDVDQNDDVFLISFRKEEGTESGTFFRAVVD